MPKAPLSPLYGPVLNKASAILSTRFTNSLDASYSVSLNPFANISILSSRSAFTPASTKDDKSAVSLLSILPIFFVSVIK